MTAPAYACRVLRLPASELREGGRVLGCMLAHMREEGNALVCAEGDTDVYTPMLGSTDLFGFGGNLASYLPESSELRYLNKSAHCAVPLQTEKVMCARAADGTDYVYVFSGSLVHAHTFAQEQSVYCGLISDCAVVAYHERLYAPKGLTVHFSALLDFTAEGWTADESEQGMSTFDLYPSCGNVVDAFVAHEKLCFLREFGMTLLTAYADVYNFRLADAPYDCGKAIGGTGAVCCGDGYFFTERGLCVFDGTKAARAEGAADGEINLSSPIRVSVRGNTLYASVTKKDGAKALYAYEPACKRGRYLLNGFSLISAREGAYLLRDGDVYELGGKGIPEGKRCALELRLSLSDLCEGEKRLESVVVEGQGAFRIRASGADGIAVSAEGGAGGRIVLPAAVRGETVSLEISSDDVAFRIDALSLCVRKEDRL